ncbi:hypothetical protein A2U01_0074928, partial [Trifolium medium]|nr:hypothetical protein [Trifolium medium]
MVTYRHETIEFGRLNHFAKTEILACNGNLA